MRKRFLHVTDDDNRRCREMSPVAYAIPCGLLICFSTKYILRLPNACKLHDYIIPPFSLVATLPYCFHPCAKVSGQISVHVFARESCPQPSYVKGYFCDARKVISPVFAATATHVDCTQCSLWVFGYCMN